MRQPLVVGNWKMHGSHLSVHQLLEKIKTSINTVKGAEVAVLPPFVFIDSVSQFLSGSPVHWGAQNVSSEAAGALTGEVSATMLAEFKCRYVLIGHSERRSLFHENDVIIAEKFKQVKQQGMRPLLCVGETGEEREAGLTLKIISQQLAFILEFSLEMLADAVIAYEPVWAIGTGKTATPEQAQEVHSAIRAQVATRNQTIADNIRLLYGGSVKASNAQTLFSMPDIDGGLIGGASLDAEEFLKICHSIDIEKR